MRSLLDVIHTYEELPSLAVSAQPAAVEELSLDGHHSAQSSAWNTALSSTHEDLRGSRSSGVNRGGSGPASVRGSHSRDRSLSNSAGSSREASPQCTKHRAEHHGGLNANPGAGPGQDYSHARTLAMLEQIQASLSRDRHGRDEP